MTNELSAYFGGANTTQVRTLLPTQTRHKIILSDAPGIFKPSSKSAHFRKIFTIQAPIKNAICGMEVAIVNKK